MVTRLAILLLAGSSVFSGVLAQSPAVPMASLPDGRNMTMPAIVSRPPLVLASSVAPGEIEIETVVNAAGAVSHTRVTRSTDQAGALERALVESLRHWRFQPARDSGGPKEALVLIRLSLTRPDGGAPVLDAKVVTVEYAPGLDRWLPPADVDATTAVRPMKPGNGVEWPSVLREVKPSYTADAMRAKVQGQVEMEIVVGADGTVSSARVTKSLDTVYGLDRSALVAARYWLFKPGTRNGVAVPTIVGLILEFRLH